MCGKIMTVLLIIVVLNCSMAQYNGRLHCIVGVLPTCYKRKAATYFYPPGGTGPNYKWNEINLIIKHSFVKGLSPDHTVTISTPTALGGSHT